MKALITKSRAFALGCVAALAMWGSPHAFAAEVSEPAITVKTAAYDVAQTDNLFTFCINVDEAIYLNVDCGFGSVEYEIEPTQDGTWFPCTVTPEGIVKMYTDRPEVINYLYCQGGHITEIDLSKLTALLYLDLSKNKLKKIDLSNNLELEYIDLGSNTFEEEPLCIGRLPHLALLEIENVGNISPDFDLSNFPELQSFAAFSTYGLTHLDTSGCPWLQRLSVDVTGLSSLDVSKNPELRVLNISDTFIDSIDVSKNTKLTQLYVSHQGRYASNYKLSSLDVTHNPYLTYLFAQGNNIKHIDLSNNPRLEDLQIEDNFLESFDCSANPKLSRLDISNNCLDFATLPLGRSFSDYYYDQRPMPVALSYPVGAQIDLSKRVLREGTVTEMLLFGISQNDITAPQALSKDYYDYADGVIKFKREYNDSVFACFYNADFPECVLTTTKFMVKTPEQYGVPVPVLSFSPQSDAGTELSFGIGVGGASPENPRTVFVDFGDGVQVPVVVECQVPEIPNVDGRRAGTGNVTVYVNDGDNITGLSIDGCRLYGIDLVKSPMLRSLSLTGTGLSYIDLNWQRCLQSLTLTGNNLGSLDLTTETLGYDKNVIENIDVSDNGLYELKIESYGALKHLNVSHNQLTNLDVSKAYDLLSLDVSYNLLTSLITENFDVLETLNVAGNRLTHVGMPWQNTLRNLDCRYNPLTFANLPCRPGELEGEYLYAPQNAVDIVSRGPSCSLKDVGMEVDGVATELVWHKEDGGILVEGDDYVCDGSAVVFKDYSLGKVYCTMTNSVYPELTLMTSMMLVDEPPTVVVGWMDVADDISVPEGQEMYLSMAAAGGGGILYIDWRGDREVFTEYEIGSTYTVFTPDAVPGRRAVIYRYDEKDFLTTFTLNSLPLKAADFSQMKSLTDFDLSYSGCSDIVWPDSERLQSLGLSGNGLSSLDATRYHDLKVLYADDNNLKSLDLSAYPLLQVASFADNCMSEIKLDNPHIWHLNLGGNEFEHFSFEGLPSLHQVQLSSNRLKSIDINGPELLRVLMIRDNCLDFQTLPIVPESVTQYYYTDQAHVPAIVNGLTVDLSSQDERDGYYTEFYWCVDEPYYDGEGALYADLLEEGVDYTIDEGVTKFNHEVANVCCLMLNELFPSTFLLTDLMTLTTLGVEAATVSAAAISVDGRKLTISAEEGTQFGVYTADGKTVATGELAGRSVEVNLPAADIYVVKAGKSSMKVAVK